MIKISEIVLRKADEPYFVAALLDADLLAGKDDAKVFFPAFVTDAATPRDGGGPVMERIVELATSSYHRGNTLTNCYDDPSMDLLKLAVFSRGQF